MENIIIDFLNQYSTSKMKKRFWYGFNINASLEQFSNEYQKFLSYKDFCFYHNNELLTVFNSYCFSFKDSDIKQMFKLYEYANENDLTNELIDISEFLLTYFRSLNTDYYAKNYAKYKKAIDVFIDISSKIGIKKKDLFFKSAFLDRINDFYVSVINHALSNDKFISPKLINRMCNNLCYMSLYDPYGKELIELLCENSLSLNYLILFDKKSLTHKDKYLAKVFDELDDNYGYSNANDLINKMDKNTLLNDEDLSNIINKYVDKTNNVTDDALLKEKDFIQLLASIDTLKEEINFLLSNIENFNESHKSKLHECLINILSSKRYIIDDENYTMKNMKSFEYKMEIPREDINRIGEELKTSKFKLYSNSTINFKKSVGESLELYAKHPVSYMLNSFHVDNEHQIYKKDLENSGQHIFKKHFDEIGENYTISHKDLLNKLDSGYYEQLLKYLATTFLSTQSLLISVLGDTFQEVISSLKKEVPCEVESDYAVIARNIIAIEANFIKILTRNNLNASPTGDGKQNLFTIAEYYKKDDFKMNGLMYLYYTLYEEFGLNLRNNIMHGSLISKDNLYAELLVTFSGLIFISWLTNEK